MTLLETIEAALELSEIIINITNAPDLTYHEKHELIDLYLAAERETTNANTLYTILPSSR